MSALVQLQERALAESAQTQLPAQALESGQVQVPEVELEQLSAQALSQAPQLPAALIRCAWRAAGGSHCCPQPLAARVA